MHSQLENPSPALNNREVALDLANRNFAVFPLCDWNKDGNWRPIRGWQTGASSDPIIIADWFRQWPDARLGLPAGEHNRFSVIDVDVKGGKDGVASLAALGFPDIEAMTPVRVRTPSGGWHLYFRYDPRLKNTVSKIGDGLDVRTERGLVMAPGSFKDGHHYQSVGAPLGSVELPDFPESLIPPPPPERERVDTVTGATEGQRDWATAYLAKLADTLADTGQGARHDTLNSTAYWAGGAAAHGFLTYGQAETALLAAAKACGLPDDEAEGTIEAAFYDGLDDPISGFPPGISDDDFDDDEDDLIGDVPANDNIDHPKVSRLRFLSPDDCENAPHRPYVIKNFIAEGDVVCIYGAPGAGKSLIAPYLAYAVAQGEPAFGLKTKAGAVFYVAAEDSRGMTNRVRALKLRRGTDAGNFWLVDGVSDLLIEKSLDLAALLKEVEKQRPALIVIDTLAMAFPGLQENDSQGMGRVMANARKLAQWGAAVLLIHHDTKAQTPTPRGHSILNGALDMAMQMFPLNDSGAVKGKMSKNRNGPCTLDIAFRIESVALGADEDGDTITAPISIDLDAGSLSRTVKLTQSEKASLDLLKGLLGNELSIPEAEWRDACIDSRTVSASEIYASRKTAFNRSYRGLSSKGVVRTIEDRVALVGVVECFDDDLDNLVDDGEEDDLIG
jgi:archaellum biogenesis ATPase FlaH